MADTTAGTTKTTQDPSCLSADAKFMRPIWSKIRDILAGLHAIRKQGEVYLPKYEGETYSEYQRRLHSTSWRPEFSDGLRNLSAKPFQKDIVLDDSASDEIKKFAEDVDGCGRNLTRFAKEYFDTALGYGLAVLLVDYPPVGKPLTLADEKAIGARPYWCLIHPENIIALYTKNVGGKEVISHIRFHECYMERDGFDEVEIDRIRVFEIAGDDEVDANDVSIAGKIKYEIWEATPETTAAARADKNKSAYSLTDSGTISLKEIPISLFFTGKKSGNFRVAPPLNDLADMQIELYQKLSNKNEIQNYAGSPMLKLVGVTVDSLPNEDDGSGKKVPTVATSPKRVIVLPPNIGEGSSQPDADFIQPAAANMAELRNDINDTIETMRRLAMQPITDKSGNPTATGQAIDQAKAHSTLQSWALGLKDALEVAMLYTAQWMQLNEEPEVSVYTDWGISADGVQELTLLNQMVMAGNLSRRTLWEECKRRDTLSQDFDANEEEEAIAEEAPALGDMGIDPVTGQPIQKKPNDNPPEQGAA